MPVNGKPNAKQYQGEIGVSPNDKLIVIKLQQFGISFRGKVVPVERLELPTH